MTSTTTDFDRAAVNARAVHTGTIGVNDYQTLKSTYRVAPAH